LFQALLSSFPPETESMVKMIVVLGLFGWMSIARLVRGSVLAIKESEYVLSAKTVGATDACESVHDCATRAYCAGELTEAEMDALCDAADAEKMESYRAAVKLAPADFLDNLLTQQRRWQ
jgi:hypothetical protein